MSINTKIYLGEKTSSNVSNEESIKKLAIIKLYSTEELIFQLIRHTLLLDSLKKSAEILKIIELLENEIKLRNTSKLNVILNKPLEIVKKLNLLLLKTTPEKVISIINSKKILKCIYNDKVVTKQPKPLKLRLRPKQNPLESQENCLNTNCIPQ